MAHPATQPLVLRHSKDEPHSQRSNALAYATDDGALPSLDLSSEFTDDVQTKVRGIIALALQSAEAQLF